MAGQKVHQAKTDMRMALAHAREFHRHVAALLKDVPSDPNGANAHLGANVAQTMFIATNLIFASELYLKVVLMLTGKTPPEHHHLWKLYRQIPVADQTIIEDEFNKEFAKYPAAFSMHMLLTTEKVLPEADVRAALDADKKTAPKGDFKSLPTILKDTGDSYQTWRYLYHSIKNVKDRRIIRFHWSHLHCMCVAIDQICVATIAKFDAEQLKV